MYTVNNVIVTRSFFSPFPSFVRVYHDTCGPLPVSANGKPLQEIITTTPGVILVGGKPSNINVTLVQPGAKMAGKYMYTIGQ